MAEFKICLVIGNFFQSIIREIKYLTETLCSYEYLIRESSLFTVLFFFFFAGEIVREVN